MTTHTSEKTASVRDCELCIVGAGYAALNGLNAAAKYLRPGERVVVIDKNASWGGQWLHQYDFLRLHQPYRLFTAGDQRWISDRPPEHLASKREVLDHLATVPRVSAGHLAIEPLFGHEYTGHRVRDGRVEVEAEPVSGGGPPVRIRARRMLKGTGIDIQMLPPLALSSERVRSVGVSDPVLCHPDFLESDAPVYVIGSGKTGMDLVLHLARSGRAGRAIHVVTGSGMWFFSRDGGYPTGWRRHWAGSLTGDTFLRMVKLFDGQNERAVMEQLQREGLAHTVFGEGGNCRYGLLSIAERAEILASVRDVFRAHLVDVDGTRMVLREGGRTRSVEVEPGSWFVNCTSHFRSVPHEAVLQDDGLVLAPQFAIGFSGTSAYYLTHAWYRGVLASFAKDLYRVELDVEPKLRFGTQVGVMVMANMSMVSNRLPMSISTRFQGDFNKWYPLHRQIPMLLRVIASQKLIMDKAERLLDKRFSDPPPPS